MSLTPRQKDILDFIVEFQVEKGYSPTYREIGEAIGVSSVGGVAAHIQNIEERGYIKTIKGNRRMIEVIKTSVMPASALVP